MSSQASLAQLLGYLEVTPIGALTFRAQSPKYPRRVFGGQVLAQALNAAAQTVDAQRIAHSMHAYFLRPGDPDQDIIYTVDPIRDGRGFTTRNVVARQADKAIFSASLSFQIPEDGLSHQFPMPNVTPPEQAEEDRAFRSRLMKEKASHANNPHQRSPIDRYTLKPRHPENPEVDEPFQNVWLRVPAEVGDNPLRHQTLLAYLSDFSLLGAALRPHPYTAFDDKLQFASLDHALWFHRPARVDDYLLYTQDSPSSAGGRGMSRGSIYTRDGTLIASVAQESLIRVLPT